ncbi:protein I'm not dead yet-like [Coccinella septempunctata]|uniref:protein I'm not dead yet-like n=1 Tax=Coccinella septempunctata TaxID=41139 RepID=UPI001D079273|nr:protein I'm not dead yet-like [Coccinella septempunctata]
MGFGRDLLFAIRIYWRAAFSIIWPIVLLPIIIIDYSEHKRCLYVVLLMTGYWITEAIHMAVTSLIPILLFPIFSLMHTDDVCKSYMKDANVMFITGMILAISVEYSRLHERLALAAIDVIGVSPRKLHLGIMWITAFISLWISNTAATAIMIPIVATILMQLEEQGIGTIYEPTEEPYVSQVQMEDTRKPTRSTMCYNISAAYAASIGGMGTLIGTGTNLTFKGIFETMFKDGPGVDFGYFMLITIPIVIVLLVFATLILQLWFLGLLRPKSKDAQSISIGPDGIAISKQVISERRKQLGPMTFHEIAVLTCFILAICLWITRDPQIFPGWAEQLTELKVQDGAVGAVVVLLLFCIPAQPNFLYAFSEDEEKRPKGPSTGLVTWKFIYRRMPWGLIFLIGSGFAIADAAKSSKMNDYIVYNMGDLAGLNHYTIMVIGCFAAGLLTQVTSNVAIANITLPIMAEMSRKFQIHPLHVMYPVCLACSFAYTLPVSTPPNAIAAASCNMRTYQMMIIGVFLLIMSWLVLFATAPFLAGLVWDFHSFPDWAQQKDNETYR